ncbi:D-alanine aminotransferase (EC 2.6.1.21) [uncultured Gammaproteobacteria bacterium]|jgi:D-alanine transaminase|uniref:D-amino acid aminotransferase n=1 Tax=thiotrophic endosymbiont of Bathymodiolus puteoserpentis (Logatchev) TaxID=343240 RepID=UPI0010BB7B8E|nr:D-amino acid aminotransferase [thiotrophic endosymbiont of Bathymodiolus puteoserpentis (Logatchev)]CAC9575415.1 D-alanine aminotransferase (EC 2.6.1.21) [uncultured Gammaproteobacteria bacterium]CAC9577831.1 D-alanine aminotransferase (EC 2.6.1.21) [uncultured Gammaproteobacteria bacterium]CAC9955666.1 D-alanine aminotransferase (EC 2.6.1.21) [uncultured Gammaproteobacteria bacterium]CAC9980382.1 D-alanine aminotransferase (EC 2.6.1.21) [uncultured Gammaproteobacteria bacterium]SSC09799.1 
MVYLNGNFIAKNKASISVMDRGFLFGDGVYEVIPAYHGKLFRLDAHLQRLQKSLEAVQISNPYTNDKWLETLKQLLSYSQSDNQSLYLQITRGADTQRKHSFGSLSPTVYIESNPLIPKDKITLEQGFSAITSSDIRWSRCDIKATSLLANTMYAQNAKKAQVEEVILHRDNIVTEGATSNVFMVKGNTLHTHPANTHILSGITRDLALESATACHLKIKELGFTTDELLGADEVWISSSTREIMPITQIDNRTINNGKVGHYWACVYNHYQQLKND